MYRKVLPVLAAALLFALPAAAQHSITGLTIESFIRADSTIDVPALLATGYVGKIDLDGYRFKMMPEGPKLCSVQTGPAAACMAPVKCAAIYDGMVVFGGMFGRAGTATSSNVVGFDGTGWVSLGQFGVDRTVFALEVYDGRLIAAGEFVEAGGDLITHIAAWDGRFWSRLGEGLNNAVFDLAVFEGRLIAAGDIAMAASHGGNSLVAWDGRTWQPVTLVNYGYIYALAVVNDQLFATGKFVGADGQSIDRIIEVSGSGVIAGDGTSSPEDWRWALSIHADMKDK